jgi:hypothetical protein
VKDTIFQNKAVTYYPLKTYIMIANFLQTIKGELAGKLAGQSDLSNDKAEEASSTVTNTVKDEISEKAQKGQLNDIMALMGKGGASSGFARNLESKVAGNLAGKVGIPQNIAAKVASFAVPFVVNKLGDFTSSKGKDNKEGIQEMLGGLGLGSLKDKLPGGLGKKFGF